MPGASRLLVSSPLNLLLKRVRMRVRVRIIFRILGLPDPSVQQDGHPSPSSRTSTTYRYPSASTSVLTRGCKEAGGLSPPARLPSRASMRARTRTSTRIGTHNLSGAAWRVPYLLPPPPSLNSHPLCTPGPSAPDVLDNVQQS